MAVIKVFADVPSEDILRLPLKPDSKEFISGQITIPLPSDKSDWIVSYADTTEDRQYMTRLKDDGSFRINRKVELGGMLRVYQTGSNSVCWMIVKPVANTPLTLPRDADLFMPKESLRDVKIVLPEERDPQNFDRLLLDHEKNAPHPLASFAKPRKYWEIKNEEMVIITDDLDRFHETNILEKQIPPGRYWVIVDYDNEEEYIALGWITVPEKDDSETVPKLRPALD